MTDARRFIIAGLVTFAMPLVVIGAPMTLSAVHVGGSDQTTQHYGKASR